MLRLRSATKNQAFQGSGVKAPPFLRYATELASPSLPILATTQEWQGMRESAYVNKRVFVRKLAEIGNVQSPNSCHDKRSGKDCARAHTLINEFSKKTRRDWATHNLLILCHDQRKWQGVRESALFKKRVFERKLAEIGHNPI